jgi:amidase
MAFMVARTLQLGASAQQADLVWAALMRDEARGRLDYLLPPGTILCMPTTPCIAPLRGQPVQALDRVRNRITCMTALGGLAGHPQVSLPLGDVGGVPVGLSIVGARGTDAALVAVAKALEETA